MYLSLLGNLRLWSVITNESSYGKIGFYEEGNKQISIFLQIFGNGLKEYDKEKGYLIDTCKFAQDKYRCYIKTML